MSNLEGQPNKSPREDNGYTITDWASKAEKISEELFGKLRESAETKAAGLNFLVKHELPRYKKIIIPLAEFLSHFQQVFDELPSPTGFYYSSVIDLETGKRVYDLEQTQEEVLEFIAENLASGKINIDSRLILSEYWHNYYGGSLLINDCGRIYVELVKGKHNKLIKGQGQLLMRAQTDKFLDIIKFADEQKIDNIEAIKLRQAVMKALNLIPTILMPISNNPPKRFKRVVPNEDGDACISVPHAGYYEFILSKEKVGDKTWKVIFIDARTDRDADKYQLSE